MITTAIMEFLLWFFENTLGTVVLPDPPDQIAQAEVTIGVIMSHAVKLGNWLPIELFMPCVAAAITSWIFGVGLKLIRIVLSFGTAGGGSAA